MHPGLKKRYHQQIPVFSFSAGLCAGLCAGMYTRIVEPVPGSEPETGSGRIGNYGFNLFPALRPAEYI